MPQISTAGRLLADLNREGSELRDLIALSAGVVLERADEAMAGAIKLTLSEQLRLAEATVLHAPTFSRQALRLRGQVLAARSYEAREVDGPAESPADRWERSPQMRR